MIPANELRQGVWVTGRDINKGATVQFKHLEYRNENLLGFGKERAIAWFFKVPNGEYIEDCEGIPLTPEILEACGFDKVPGKNDTFNLPIELSIAANGQLPCYFLLRTLKDGRTGGRIWTRPIHEAGIVPYKISISGAKDILYLHQLQNAVYVLYGVELTVNLPSNQSA